MTFKDWWEKHRGEFDPRAETVFADLWRVARAPLELELEGERKANALLNAGMESLSESRDELKHKCRQLEARVAELEAALEPFAGAGWAYCTWDTMTLIPTSSCGERPTVGDCRRAAAVLNGGRS